jgi:hypothetical protein
MVANAGVKITLVIKGKVAAATTPYLTCLQWKIPPWKIKALLGMQFEDPICQGWNQGNRI